MTEKETRISIANNDIASAFFGTGDENFRYLRSLVPADISARGSEIYVKGAEAEVNQATELVNSLLDICRTGRSADH